MLLPELNCCILFAEVSAALLQKWLTLPSVYCGFIMTVSLCVTEIPFG